MKFVNVSKKPLAVGIVVAVLAILDILIAPIFAEGKSFAWIAFLGWNIFFGSTLLERGKALLGIIIGYLCANAIVILSNCFGNIVSVSVATVLAIFIINFLAMYLENAKKLFLDSIPGVFLGIAATFSGAGIGLATNSFVLFEILIIYGILGVLCGLSTNFLTTWFRSFEKKKS